MTEREQRTTKPNQSTEESVHGASSARGDEVADKIDDLLDEIDSVLEENAEEFVKNYVQKGGQ